MSSAKNKKIRGNAPAAHTNKSVPNQRSFDEVTKYEESRFQFSSEMIDLEVGKPHGCAWEWGPDKEIWKDLLDCLSDFSQKSWKEIEAERTGGQKRHKKHHSMDVSILHKSAQARIQKLHGDDAPDSIFRFRLSGTKRLWGFRIGAIFHIVWFDANHDVYPVDK
ncbi:hypothetical protein [Glutamicibacter ardleyensis]|uniref:Uncharacterized protein n=1 Tax=Glutamicibacter ardleyensis TaxID=225894 RepID=A0ABQ2DXF7_9MICC|nr:hypothetical protein [Glutamicibacter ardleyensis]GGJ72822.1 hypothetical protein GCM10007173_34790 [Glutamicibacter ardleyensis]